MENDDQIDAKLAFYHWVSKIDLSEHSETLQSKGFERMYVHMFDVVVAEDGQPVPVAAVHGDSIPNNFEIVPTVFIQNNVFLNLNDSHSDTLANLIFNKINRQLAQLHYKQPIEEFQIDCDWTEKTRDAYFQFLRSYNKLFSGQLSVTIRLYPYKYRSKMGVPPVDRGMLMYYNMGDLGKVDEQNSILNNHLGKQYLNTSVYPLPLDVALPVFNWNVLFRQNSFSGLIKSVKPREWSNLKFVEKTAYNRYKVLSDTVFRDVYYRYGDVIRVESIKSEDLSEAINYLKPLLDKSNYLTIYHINQVHEENEEVIDHIIESIH